MSFIEYYPNICEIDWTSWSLREKKKSGLQLRLWLHSDKNVPRPLLGKDKWFSHPQPSGILFYIYVYSH